MEVKSIICNAFIGKMLVEEIRRKLLKEKYDIKHALFCIYNKFFACIKRKLQLTTQSIEQNYPIYLVNFTWIVSSGQWCTTNSAPRKKLRKLSLSCFWLHLRSLWKRFYSWNILQQLWTKRRLIVKGLVQTNQFE